MVIWFALCIPIIFSLGMLIFYHKKIVWWEIIVPLLVSLFLVAIFKGAIGSLKTRDVEYWGNYVVSTRYYEDWNEYIHQTCTRTVSCGENCTTIETYDCSYVQYHSSYYTIVLNSGEEKNIKKSQYARLKNFFGNSNFVELNRNYHTDDGDLWESHYDGSYEKFEFIATKHIYKNKVQVSDDVFNFPEVDTADVSFYALYEYPLIEGFYKLPAILHNKSFQLNETVFKKYDWINGKLGMEKQLRVWILLYDKPRTAGQLQEALWKGGNKNEFNVAIGLKGNKVQWCYPFSWTEMQSLKIETRNFVEEMDTLNLSKLADFLYNELERNFVRKSFEEFDYLTIEPPLWAILVTYIVTFLVNFGIAIWAIRNEYEKD